MSFSLAQTELKIWKYWSAVTAARYGVVTSFAGMTDEAVDVLDLLANDALRQQMLADMLLGAYLSSGINSSLVVALMRAQSVRPIKTFAIGFNEKGTLRQFSRRQWHDK